MWKFYGFRYRVIIQNCYSLQAYFKHRTQKRQRAQIIKTSCTDDFVCFEVSFDDKKVSDTKVPSCVASPRRRHKLTVEDLEEKQRKAEERRKVCFNNSSRVLGPDPLCEKCFVNVS